MHLIATPFDYSPFTTALFTILGGLAAALGTVLAAALLLRAIFWGVPRLVAFFTMLSDGMSVRDAARHTSQID